MSNSSAWPTDEIERVIKRHGDMLYRLCLIMLKNESDTEDAVQETLITYCRKAPSFADGEHEKAWLIRVAANRCRDVIRFRARHPQVDYLDLSESASCDSTESGILDALAALPEKYRLVLTLYYVEEYRTEDIAKIIGKTPSAVRMRLQKGRKLLEEIYRKEYM